MFIVSSCLPADVQGFWSQQFSSSQRVHRGAAAHGCGEVDKDIVSDQSAQSGMSEGWVECMDYTFYRTSIETIFQSR